MNESVLGMFFRPSASGCGSFHTSDDGHNHCVPCLGRKHAEMAFMDGSCLHCERMSMAMLRSRLSFILRLPSGSTQSGSSGRKDLGARLVRDKGDLRIMVRNSTRPVPMEVLLLTGLSHGIPIVSFGAPEET